MVSWSFEIIRLHLQLHLPTHLQLQLQLLPHTPTSTPTPYTVYCTPYNLQPTSYNLHTQTLYCEAMGIPRVGSYSETSEPGFSLEVCLGPLERYVVVQSNNRQRMWTKIVQGRLEEQHVQSPNGIRLPQAAQRNEALRPTERTQRSRQHCKGIRTNDCCPLGGPPWHPEAFGSASRRPCCTRLVAPSPPVPPTDKSSSIRIPRTY